MIDEMKVQQQRPAGRTIPAGRHFVRIVSGLMLACLLLSYAALAIDERKIKSGEPPEYPELARRLGLRGTARVQATVAPDGTVKQVKDLGGNPVLVDALARAVKKWKYEPSDKTSIVEVKFDFVFQSEGQ
ncbi:MAG TPA: energy transducer TonB [Verrucomicrobiae bacterium]|nr:energy transducer TonB [Verrucomicrobiae bacterium]